MDLPEQRKKGTEKWKPVKKNIGNAVNCPKGQIFKDVQRQRLGSYYVAGFSEQIFIEYTELPLISVAAT